MKSHTQMQKRSWRRTYERQNKTQWTNSAKHFAVKLRQNIFTIQGGHQV